MVAGRVTLPSALRKMRADAGWLASAWRAERQRIGDVVVDGETLARERDRRRDRVRRTRTCPSRICARRARGRRPSRARRREAGIARLERIGLAVGVEEHVLGRRRGRGLAIVDRDRLIAIGAMNQHEAAAADIAGARQGDGERKADRDRRIDGVAAAPQHIETDARRRRLLAHDHAVPGDDRTRGGERGDDRRRVGADAPAEARQRKAKAARRSGLKADSLVPAARHHRGAKRRGAPEPQTAALEPLARLRLTLATDAVNDFDAPLYRSP